jgi:hypothetical protein
MMNFIRKGVQNDEYPNPSNFRRKHIFLAVHRRQHPDAVKSLSDQRLAFLQFEQHNPGQYRQSAVLDLHQQYAFGSNLAAA